MSLPFSAALTLSSSISRSSRLSFPAWTWFPSTLEHEIARCPRFHTPWLPSSTTHLELLSSATQSRPCTFFPHPAFLVYTDDHLWCRLYGITTLQTFMYYRYNPNDPVVLKASVSACCPNLARATSGYPRAIRYVPSGLGRWSMVSQVPSYEAGCQTSTYANRSRCERVLDTFHVGLITAAMYWYCITNFANLLAVQRPVWYAFPSCCSTFTVTHPHLQGPSLCVRPNADLPAIPC